MAAIVVSGVRERDRPLTRAYRGIADLADGLRLVWLWTRLAQQDIKLRYRGSVLGPFWQTVTTGLMIGGLGLLYPRLFNVQIREYLPMLAMGLVFWMFISGLIIEGCGTFTEVSHIIHVVKLPFSTHAYRVVYRSFLAFAHNFVIILIVMVVFPSNLDWTGPLLFLLGFLLIVINGIWITLLFGMFSARYRDVPPIVASIVQLLMFMTPIFWQFKQLGPEGWWVQFSPIFAAIDVMRAPLLGGSPERYSWDIVLMTTILGWAGTFALFSRLRHRLPFWV